MITTEKQKLSRVLMKVIVVNILNLLVVLAIMLLLRQLPMVALNVKRTNSQEQISSHSVDSTILKAEMDKSKVKTDTVLSMLGGDKTVISFITRMDELKKEGFLISYEFPITNEILDKTGLHGLPVLMVIQGTKQNISETLVKISEIKVLLRPVTLSITTDETGLLTAKYGVFMYTQ